MFELDKKYEEESKRVTPKCPFCNKVVERLMDVELGQIVCCICPYCNKIIGVK